MLTQRDIEANPEKCNAIIEMRSPNNIKEVQRLIGRLTAISRFLPKLVEQTQPIISLLQQTLVTPSTTNICLNLDTNHAKNWTTPYIQYLKTGNPPLDADKSWLAKAARYTMIRDDLYKRRYGQPLFKCVIVEQTQYIIRELHEDICGYHSGARTMTTKKLRAGYFWPTMEVDCHTFVKKCIPCQM